MFRTYTDTMPRRGWGDGVKAMGRVKTSPIHTNTGTTLHYRTTPTDVLEELAGQIPIDMLIKQNTLEYHIRKGNDFEYGEIRRTAGWNNREEIATAKAAITAKIRKTSQSRWSLSEKGRTTYSYFLNVRMRYHANQGYHGYPEDPVPDT